MNQFKSTLIKLSAGIALSATGILAINIPNQPQVKAATTSQISISNKEGATIWTNYQAGSKTDAKAFYHAKYKVIGTATDQKGNRWYAIGYQQWILASDTQKVASSTSTNSSNFNININFGNSSASKKSTSTSSYTSNLSSSETAAKAWIAMHESSNSYSARNGKYIGKYQLDSSYLNGDYSAANQERVADNYVKSRYGSWVNAKKFWQNHNWY